MGARAFDDHGSRQQDWIDFDKLSRADEATVAAAVPDILQFLHERDRYAAQFADQVTPSLNAIRKLTQEAPEEFAKAAFETKDVVNSAVRNLENSIAALTRFHNGIYRSEKIWFWAYDIAPVVALFIVAMVPFVGLFLRP